MMSKKRLSTIVLVFVASVIAYLFLLPFIFMVFTSFKELEDSLTATSLFPKRWTLQNYVELFQNTSSSPVTRWLGNTILVTVTGTALRLTVSTTAAYALSRLDVPGKKLIVGGLVWGMAIPEIVTLFPLFYIFKQIGMINTYWPLILPSGSGVMVIYYIYTFLQDFPMELEEAAYLDGASIIKILRYIVLPSIRPVLVTHGFITFLGLYNNFLWSSLVVNQTKMQTVTLGLATLTLGENDNRPGLMMAATAVAVLPVLLVFLFANKYIVRGFTRSGIK